MDQRIVMLGPPAAGKGTQAELLKREYGFDNPSVGAMLRQQRAAGTAAGIEAANYFERGLLVPDAITIEVVRQWLSARNGGSWVLDGYPRTIEQCRAFEEMLAGEGLALDAAVLLRIEEPVVRNRASRRLVCTACGGVFGSATLPPPNDAPCPQCDAALTRRADDEPESVTRRLSEYRERTEPLVPHYRASGILHEFDGNRPAPEIFSDLSRALGCAPAGTRP